MNNQPTINVEALENNIIRRRIIACLLIVLALALMLLFRLAYLQIVAYTEFATQSRENSIDYVPLAPVRGLIYDRNGIPLAQNISVYTLELVPDKVGHDKLDSVVAELGQLVDINEDHMIGFRRQLRRRPGFEQIVLKSKLTDEEVARLAVNKHRFPGVSIQARLQRYYPLASLGVHVVGYVGRVSEKDLERIDQDEYRGTRYIGKLGIERFYEGELHGSRGVAQVETNAHGRVVRELSHDTALAGKNLHLALDIELQRVALEALGEELGAVVAIDPNNGDVLAFASNPTYDPNLFVNGIGHQEYSELRNSDDRPLLNRAFNGRYAPGSTIKPIVGLAGLHSGRSPHQKVYDPGFFRLPNSRHRYRCWKRVGHGSVDLHDALMHSCDTYFYSLANQLGIEGLHNYLVRFGLGVRTGIDLGSEPTGLVPNKEWKKKIFKQVWFPGETVIAGIGQGYTLATPLQLAVATATLANRGHLVVPRLVNGLSQGQSTKVEALQPQAFVDLEVPSDHMEYVIHAMEDVVHHERGTARRIADAPYRIAGKTGTAQVVGIAQGKSYDEDALEKKHRDHALFTSFAPVEEPKIAVAVVVENGGSGGRVAAPIARDVMDYYLLGEVLSRQKIKPDD